MESGSSSVEQPKSIDDVKPEELTNGHPSNAKKFLSQVMASMSIFLLQADYGMAGSYTTIVVGALSQNRTEEPHRYQPFSLSDSQVSLYVSILHIFQPLGSIFGGFLIDIIGRKILIILANFPMIAAWLLSLFAVNPTYLFASNALFGFGMGLSECPQGTYLGEANEKTSRGTIAIMGCLFAVGAYSIPFLIQMGVLSWQRVAGICLSLPLITLVISLTVPESPLWLVARGDLAGAEASLTRLRGGTGGHKHLSHIKEELEHMIHYHNRTRRSSSASTVEMTEETAKSGSGREETVSSLLKCLFHRRVAKPFGILVIMFSLNYFVGYLTMRGYLETIFIHMHSSFAMFMTLTSAGGTLIGTLAISRTGKRLLTLAGHTANACCCLIIALILFGILPRYLLPYFLFIMAFIGGIGIIPIPWVLLTELFPYRARGPATGLAAAANNLIAAVTTYVFIPVVDSIGLASVFCCFGAASLAGIIFIAFCLPETEGKTLWEIEEIFRKKKNNGSNSGDSSMKSVR